LAFIAVPLGALDTRLRGGAQGAHLATPARVAIVLGLSGLIYGFLSPDFGLNEKSLYLFLALVIGLGIGTYLQEGGSVLLAERRYGAKSSVRPFGAAIGVAIICVLASRLVGLQPGFVYGFVASSVILSSIALSKRASANLVIIPSVALLIASLLAWVVLGPLASAAQSDATPWNVLLANVAAAT